MLLEVPRAVERPPAPVAARAIAKELSEITPEITPAEELAKRSCDTSPSDAERARAGGSGCPRDGRDAESGGGRSCSGRTCCRSSSDSKCRIRDTIEGLRCSRVTYSPSPSPAASLAAAGPSGEGATQGVGLLLGRGSWDASESAETMSSSSSSLRRRRGRSRLGVSLRDGDMAITECTVGSMISPEGFLELSLEGLTNGEAEVGDIPIVSRNGCTVVVISLEGILELLLETELGDMPGIVPPVPSGLCETLSQVLSIAGLAVTSNFHGIPNCESSIASAESLGTDSSSAFCSLSPVIITRLETAASHKSLNSVDALDASEEKLILIRDAPQNPQQVFKSVVRGI